MIMVLSQSRFDLLPLGWHSCLFITCNWRDQMNRVSAVEIWNCALAPLSGVNKGFKRCQRHNK